MIIRCGIIGHAYDSWMDEWFSHYKSVVFKRSYMDFSSDEMEDAYCKRLANRYDLIMMEEEVYFSVEPQYRWFLAANSTLIISGNTMDYKRVRRVFLDGCFDYIEETMDSSELQALIMRLSEHFLQDERKRIQLAKAIAEEIAAVYPKTEKLFLEYWTQIDAQKQGAEYHQNDYAKAMERLIEFLPLKPIRLPLIDLAQGAAEWICQAAYSQERFMATMIFIQQSYRDVFLPHCKHPLVRRAIELYLDEQFDVETVQDLADHLYVNRSYLSKTFIAESQTDLTRYMMRTKMYGARLLLLDPRLSVYDVMEYLRYTDYGHFRKIFKKYTGITPSEYVATFRERFSVEVAQK